MDRREFRIIEERIKAESRRFEESVAESPFLPNEDNLHRYCQELFTQHCAEVDNMAEQKPDAAAGCPRRELR